MGMSLTYNTRFIVLPAHWPVSKALTFLSRQRVPMVIIRRLMDEREFFYLYEPQELRRRLAPDDPRTVGEALDLHEPMGQDVVAADVDFNTITNRVVVVSPEGRILGYFEGGSKGSDYLEATPSDFASYPALEAPARVEPHVEFAVNVGFTDAPDTTLVAQSGKLLFKDVRASDECTLIVHGDGVELDRAMDVLPLRQNALVRFKAKATRSDGMAKVRAEYYFRNQRIGYAEREIAIGAATTPEPEAVSSTQVSAPDSQSPIDLTLSVSLNSDKRLVWTLAGPHVPVAMHQIESTVSLDSCRQFVAGLFSQLKGTGFTGLAGFRLLTDNGYKISDFIPQAVWDALKTIATKEQRLPVVLLCTNEPYIPWELATLPDDVLAVLKPLIPPQDDGEVPPFLASQTVMGRWLSAPRVPALPPQTVQVKTMSVVSGTYSPASGVANLPMAQEEAKYLVTAWKAFDVPATLADIEPLLESQPPSDGHLLHFAVHGMNMVQSSEQFLILTDGKKLYPSSLMDRSRSTGGDPRFVFVFLNACQVGTAGSTLEQVSGFPGTLLAYDLHGFLAPLWEAVDKDAREFAEQFYAGAFEKHIAAGELVRRYRCSYQNKASLTPLAYVLYGHPCLQLQFVQGA